MSEYRHLDDDDLREQHEIHRRNFVHLKKQQAKSGTLHERLDLQHQIADETAKLEAIEAELQRRQTAPPAPANASPQPPAAPLPERNPFEHHSQQPIGREVELQRAVEKLQHGHCAIVGPPGSGKTLLLRTLHASLPAQFDWHQPHEVLRISLGQYQTMSMVQQCISDHLGCMPRQLVNTLRRKPLRLLLLDDVGAMATGKGGYDLRRWLRTLGDHRSVKLVYASNSRLSDIFDDDPLRDSPFATLDMRPLVLEPLSTAKCHELVSQRLAGTPLAVAAFADLWRTPQQPQMLLHLCAVRYDELRRSQP